jgi:hypothetical protein
MPQNGRGAPARRTAPSGPRPPFCPPARRRPSHGAAASRPRTPSMGRRLGGFSRGVPLESCREALAAVGGGETPHPPGPWFYSRAPARRVRPAGLLGAARGPRGPRPPHQAPRPAADVCLVPPRRERAPHSFFAPLASDLLSDTGNPAVVQLSCNFHANFMQLLCDPRGNKLQGRGRAFPLGPAPGPRGGSQRGGGGGGSFGTLGTGGGKSQWPHRCRRHCLACSTWALRLAWTLPRPAHARRVGAGDRRRATNARRRAQVTAPAPALTVSIAQFIQTIS